MTVDVFLDTGLLALMGMVSVCLWTIRVALTARGRRAAASAAAGVEAIVFVLVFASVLGSLDSPVEVAGYAAGVAAGTQLGVYLDSRLSTGQSAVRIIVDGHGPPLTTALRMRGWPVTQLPAEGLSGRAAVLLLVIDDHRLPQLTTDLQTFAAGAFWTTERLHSTTSAPLPAGYHRAGTRRPRR